MQRLRRRAEFLRAHNGVRASRGCIMIEGCVRGDHTGARIGFTATRKIGSAVARNRAKRRMREAARAVLEPAARDDLDYVLIARPGLENAAWKRLLDDLSAALLRLHTQIHGRDPVSDPKVADIPPR